MDNSEIRLTWEGMQSHCNHLQEMLSFLQFSSCLVDMSLVCETGQVIKCHRIILAAASPMLRQLMEECNGEPAVLILPNINYQDLVSIMELAYRGETTVNRSNRSSLLATAASLDIQGIHHHDEDSSEPQDLSMKTQTIAGKRKRDEELMTETPAKIRSCPVMPPIKTELFFR